MSCTIEKNALVEALLNTLLQTTKPKDTCKGKGKTWKLESSKGVVVSKKPNGSWRSSSKYSFTKKQKKKENVLYKSSKDAIHLPDEAILGGPIRYRWMFPFERYMKKLKNYVRNKAKPEGSIAEGYVAEEALTFCSRYLKDDVETRFNRLGRNDDGLPEEETTNFQVFRGRLYGLYLTTVLKSDADILAYREKSPDNVETNFPAWFNHKDSLKKNGVSTLGLDGEMYYGQLEEILELTYIGNHLARQPRGWKVVEHVYHRDMAESDQDVIHGSSSSNVTLSVELTNFEHTDLSNAEDDDVAHVLDDDDDVVVSDDDEVNPSTNVEEMACVFPRSHGRDAGGSPPRWPNRPVPAQCESSNLRIETGNASLRRAFRQNDQRPLTIGFDYGDLGTFHPTGDYASMLNSLMGETVRYLPFACEWEEIPEAYKAHIFPTLESYFDLASWYNNQDKVVMGNNVYTVGDRVKLGLQLKLRILWRKNKQRIKADHFTRYGSAEEARNHLPPKKVWGDRTEDEWNNLVDWWSHPDRVARSLQNAANRAKNTILTHQGKKSFAQGRNEYLETDIDKKIKSRVLRKQTAEAQQRAYLAALKADAAYQNSETMYGAIGEYFSNYAPNPTRPFMPPAFARPTMPQLSPEWAHLLNPPFPYNQPLQPSYAGPSQYTGPPGYTGPPTYTPHSNHLQPSLCRAIPFIPVTNNNFNNCYHPIMNSNLASTSNSQPELPRFITNPHNNDTRSVDELARDKAGEDNDVEEDEQQSGGDYSEDEEGI
ncbi:Myc-type, basic helix-loop-helix domain-containing protein [Tanacetum coccineum]